MGHAPHSAQPGYTPAQVLHDGCAECDSRAARADHGLDNMDLTTFERAWERAATWQRSGLADLARNEMPAFRVLHAVMVQLERRGLPYGYLPRGDMDWSALEAAAPGLMDTYGEAGDTL